MRAVRSIAIVALALSTASLAFAWRPHARAVENLHAFAKLYGYVRWFHPSDEAAATDWDRFAVYGARRVVDARDAEELRRVLEALFRPIAPTVRVYPEGGSPGPPEPVPADTARLEIVAWQHLGVGLGAGGPYRSVRLNRPPPYGEPGGVAYQLRPAEDLRGREIRLSAAARFSPVASGGRFGLFLQVHGASGRISSVDMEARPIASAEWDRYAISGGVAEEAEAVVVGAMLSGTGEGRVDDVRLEVLDGDAWREADLENAGFATADPDGEPAGWRVQSQGPADHRVDVVTEGDRSDVLVLALDEVPDADPLFEERPAFGEAAAVSLGAGLRARVPLALYGDGEGTLPRARVAAQDGLRRELAAIDPAALGADDPAVRAAAIVVAWNVLQHFYAYFDVVEVEWEAVLDRALARSLEDSSARRFLGTLDRMLFHLDDAHAYAFHPVLEENRGLPIWPGWIEGRIVVTATGDPEVARVGDVVLGVDGEDAERWLEREIRHWSGSERWRRFRALTDRYRGLGRGPAGSEARLTLLRDERTVEIRAVRDAESIPEPPRPKAFGELADGIVYVDLAATGMAEIESRIEELARARGVVFDLRGPLRETRVRQLLGHLTGDTLRSGHFHIPRAIYPDRRKRVGWESRGRWTLPPREPRFRGRAAFLSGPRVSSFPEGILDIVNHYGLGEIVGRASAGVMGNVQSIALPGGFTVRWTGMKYLAPDSSRFHAVGVPPTIRVEPTRAEILEGRDQALERAVEVLSGHPRGRSRAVGSNTPSAPETRP